MSLAIGVDGLGLVSYTRRRTPDSHELKVAHCSDIACTSARLSTLVPDIGWSHFTSLTIGADGLGLITFRDDVEETLKVAHCSDISCSTATISTLDDHPGADYSSTTIGADGLGLIAYRGPGPNNVKVAHCLNIACTEATTTGVADGFTGAITIGADGLGLISSVAEKSDDTLQVAHCADVACTSAEVSALDTAESMSGLTAITTGSDGHGLISYLVGTNTGGFNGVKVAHCENVSCSTTTVSPMRSGHFEEVTSIAIGSDGLAIVSYQDVDGPLIGTLRVGRCQNVACTSSSLTTVDGRPDVGWANSTTIGVDGMPLIAYAVGNDLGVAHCSNVYCVPYFRRR
jgi:hypothetical protein